jgi:hypothetical protein
MARRHAVDTQPGTLYRAAVYRRRSRRLWLLLVIPTLMVIGLCALALGIALAVFGWQPNVPFSAAMIGGLGLAWLAGSLPWSVSPPRRTGR